MPPTVTRLQCLLAVSYLLLVVGFASCWHQPGATGTRHAHGRVQVRDGGQEQGGNEGSMSHEEEHMPVTWMVASEKGGVR